LPSKYTSQGRLSAVDPRLEQYMSEVSQHPVLSRQEEHELAVRFVRDQDIQAAHQLVVANLRFVVKVAHSYARYGLRLLDLVQEGNVGLMVAVKKFDPSRGYRLISYAVWWIRAYIQGFIMRSWSLVRMGATRLHRKLFFRLRSLRAEAQRQARRAPHEAAASPQRSAPASVASPEPSGDDALWGVDSICLEVARQAGASPRATADMQQRLAARDFSLDTKVGAEADSSTYLEHLAEPQANQEEVLAAHQTARVRKQAVRDALSGLNTRERAIVQSRLLDDEPATLQEIGSRYSVSRERIRQIESRALDKLRRALAPALAC
jgi:RNA polymerase sigma-32 factor